MDRHLSSESFPLLLFEECTEVPHIVSETVTKVLFFAQMQPQRSYLGFEDVLAYYARRKLQLVG